jgi:hypothetical protein
VKSGPITFERVAHSGALIASAMVTDGTDTWLHRVTFYDYTYAEARRLFRADMESLGLRFVEED